MDPTLPDSLLQDLAKAAGGITGIGAGGYILIRLLEAYSKLGSSYEKRMQLKDAQIKDLNEDNQRLRGERTALKQQLAKCRKELREP